MALPEGLPDAVVRLAASRDGQAAVLLPHHLEAAARLVRLFERARLHQRTTMSYDPGRVGRSGAAHGQGDISDTAADARRRLGKLATEMPAECWSLLFDICGAHRGLQDVEQSRGWPRRSAKLVLRIGLDQLAIVLGLTGAAHGPHDGPDRVWRPQRLPMFAENGN